MVKRLKNALPLNIIIYYYYLLLLFIIIYVRYINQIYLKIILLTFKNHTTGF